MTFYDHALFGSLLFVPLLPMAAETRNEALFFCSLASSVFGLYLLNRGARALEGLAESVNRTAQVAQTMVDFACRTGRCKYEDANADDFAKNAPSSEEVH